MMNVEKKTTSSSYGGNSVHDPGKVGSSPALAAFSQGAVKSRYTASQRDETQQKNVKQQQKRCPLSNDIRIKRFSGKVCK